MTRSFGLLVLLCVGGCLSGSNSDGDGAAAGGAQQAPDDLGRVLAIARTCMRASDPMVVLLSHEALTSAGDGLWEVRIRDHVQTVHEVVVDVDRSACGSHVVDAPASPSLGSLSGLMDRAWECGQELGGTGVGGTPLLRGGIRLHATDGVRRTFSVPEVGRRQVPSGLDLVADDRCGRLPMD